MPDSEVRYCVIAMHYAGSEDKPEFLTVDGRIVIFDTLIQAQNFVPRMGAGRSDFWSADKETIYFSPTVLRGYNSVSIWTGYDPYDVNTGFMRLGDRSIRSESKYQDWKYHIHVHEVFKQLIAFADQNSAEEFMPTSGSQEMVGVS